jgi:hypothetical protein
VLEVIRWHIDHGYAGPQFLFSPDGTFPKHLNSHERPLRAVQKALELPLLSRHQIGRHSMAKAKPRQTVNRSEPSRLNSGTAQLRAPKSTRTLVAALNCVSFGRSNRRRRHIVVNIWSTRVKIENRETRKHWSGRLDSKQRPHAPKASQAPARDIAQHHETQ